MKQLLKCTCFVIISLAVLFVSISPIPVNAHPLVPIIFTQPPIEEGSTTTVSMKIIFDDITEPFIITVDDGYSRPALKELIAIKQQYGESFKCLLFPYGLALKDNEDLFQQLIKEGCELHNHTYTHMYFRHKTAQQQEQEIMLDDAEIEKVYKMAGQQRPYTKFFRPPGGIYDQTTLQLCIKHGYKIMLWNVITEPNGKNLSVGSRADLIRRAPKGSIILLHSKVSDMDALKIVLPGLIKRYGTQWH